MARVDPYSKEAVGRRLRQVRLAIMAGEDNQAAFTRLLKLTYSSQWNNAETGDNFPGKTVLDALRFKYGVGSDFIFYDDQRALPREYAEWIANHPDEDEKPAKRA